MRLLIQGPFAGAWPLRTSCAFLLCFILLLVAVWGVACTPGPEMDRATSPLPAATTVIPQLPATEPSPAGLPTLTPIPTPVPGGLYVDAAVSLGPVSPLSYGANHGPFAAVTVELQEAAENAGITFLRFPGGNWGDQNNLQPYQIDQFMELAGRMGAEPSISVRLLGGTPEQAAELVRYVNVESGYNVRYWSIGNEPNLYGDDYDVQRFNTEWRTFAEAMLAVDPDIVLIGPELSQYPPHPGLAPRDSRGRDWMREFLRVNGDMVDIVSIHRYPFPRSLSSPPATIAELRGDSREWDAIIYNLRAVIRTMTGRDLPVAVTEANSHYNSASGGEATPDSFYNAIWWGDVLGRLIRQRVEIVAYFTLQIPPRYGGWGLLVRTNVNPTYYVYQIYQRFGSELVYASSDDPYVSIYAARRDDGALTLVMVNLAGWTVRPLRLANFNPTDTAEVWLLDADHMAEPLGEQPLSASVALPPQSITLYIISPER